MNWSQILNRESRFFILIFFTVMAISVTWGWLSIAYYVQTGFMAILSGYLCGLATGLYFRKEKRGYYYLLGLIATLACLFLGQYISYAHLYEERDYLTNTSLSKMGISFMVLVSITFRKFFHFSGYYLDNSGLLEWFWVLLAIATFLFQIKRIPQYKLREHKFRLFLQRLRQKKNADEDEV